MEADKSISSRLSDKEKLSLSCDELANLRRINEVDNQINVVLDDLIICSADEKHVREVAELWANLASIQQLIAPQRYSFNQKDWQRFVREKLDKKSNLLLVTHKLNDPEIKGFLYLQTITLPSSDLVLKGVLEDIYTKPQYRRSGAATKLLDVGIEWALNHNIKQIDLISFTKIKELTYFYLDFIKKSKKDINLELVSF